MCVCLFGVVPPLPPHCISAENNPELVAQKITRGEYLMETTFFVCLHTFVYTKLYKKEEEEEVQAEYACVRLVVVVCTIFNTPPNLEAKEIVYSAVDVVFGTFIFSVCKNFVIIWYLEILLVVVPREKHSNKSSRPYQLSDKTYFSLNYQLEWSTALYR